MALFRAVFFEFLVLIHVIGAAALFRRFFPRESPWFGFFVPTLALVGALNFIEHFIALPDLGILLPFTLGGLVWALLKPGYSWEGLKLPSILFVILFTFCLALKCISPDIPNWTEGAHDMSRVLEYCLGEKVPPTDIWMPPYVSAAYYSYQHYGASVLTRLFSVDIGTGYNLSFALLAALTGLIGAGAGYSVSGKRAWVAIATALVLMAGSTGAAIFLDFLGRHDPDYVLSLVINSACDVPGLNPFAGISAHDQYHPWLKLLPPLYTLYYSEYHANLGGAFIVMACMLASNEIFSRERSNWPWICLIALPMIVLITSTWFFFIILFFSAGGMVVALLASRRPQDWRLVILYGLIALILVWPSVNFLLVSAPTYPRLFSWTEPDFRTPLWIFLVQFWPVYLPWLFLCFAWKRLSLAGRWFHAAIPIVFIWIEFVTVGERQLQIEKMWGAIYGAGLVTLVPLVFAQRALAFRLLTIFVLFTMTVSMIWWLRADYGSVDEAVFCRLQGDHYLVGDAQKNRLLEVMSQMHGLTILPGKSVWGYNQAPAAISFSKNRCYIAWSYQEEQCGRTDEPEIRDKLNNSFYAGTMADPLPFLQANNISAVLIWPEDKISDDLLHQFEKQIGSNYYYIDCRMGFPDNAGLFVRQTAQPLQVSTPKLPAAPASSAVAPGTGPSPKG
jgi:hypothetical protein